MTALDDRVAPPPARIPPVYLAGWALLGALAIVYLAVLALRPELAPPLNLQPPQGLPESNQSQRAMARAIADIGDLKSALERVESELKETRAATQQQERRSVALELRLSVLEARLREPAPPIAQASPAAARGDGDRLAGSADRLAGSAVDGTVEGTAGDVATAGRGPISAPPQFRTTTLQPGGAEASRAASPARTAAANVLAPPTVASAGKTATDNPALDSSTPGNPAPEKPAPDKPGSDKIGAEKPGPVQKPASEAKAPPLGLLIATGPSLDAVRLTWLLLQEGHKSTLKSLEPRYIESAGDPPTYQLVAGPVGGREAARRACERLRAKQARCSVIPYAGKSL